MATGSSRPPSASTATSLLRSRMDYLLDCTNARAHDVAKDEDAISLVGLRGFGRFSQIGRSRGSHAACRAEPIADRLTPLLEKGARQRRKPNLLPPYFVNIVWAQPAQESILQRGPLLVDHGIPRGV